MRHSPYERRNTRNVKSFLPSLDKCDSHIEQLMLLALDRALPNNAKIFQQFKIGKYKADFFVCTNLKKIVIECDGKQYHTRVNQIIYDNNRDQFMRSLGYEIIRFSGSDIFRNHESCALKVRERLLTKVEITATEVTANNSIDSINIGRGRAANKTTNRLLDDFAVRNLLALCGDHPRLIALLSEEVLQSIDNPALSDLLRDARDLATADGPPEGPPEAAAGTLVSVDKLIELAPPEIRSLVATAALSGKFIHTENPEAELYRIYRDLRAHAIQREVIDLQKQLIGLTDDPIRANILEHIQDLTVVRSCLLSNKPIPTAAEIADERARVKEILVKIRTTA